MERKHLTKRWQFYTTRNSILNIRKSSLFFLPPLSLFAVLWGMTGSYDFAPSSIALYFSLFVSANLLAMFKTEVNNGVYSFRLSLALVAIAFLPYGTDIRTSFLVWALGNLVAIAWERQFISGVSWALTSIVAGMISIIFIEIFGLMGVSVTVAIFPALLLGYVAHGLMFRAFTFPADPQHAKDAVIRLRPTALMLHILMVAYFVFSALVVRHRTDMLGLDYSETSFAPAFMLLLTASVFTIFYERYLYRWLQNKFMGVINAALQLPWGTNIAEARTSLVAHSAKIIRNGWAGLRSTPPTKNEIGVGLSTSHTKGSDKFLIINRGTLGSPFTDMDEGILNALVHIGEVNIASHQEQQKLLKDAETDPLTGLANYRALRSRLEGAMHNGEMSALFLDIDDFKLVNDRYGHQVGNEVLVELAKRIRESIRTGDLAARIGGDEFFVLFEGTSSVVADRIRKRMKVLASQPFTLTDGSKLQVGVSIGLHYVEQLDDINDFFDSSDRAMYQHKRDDIVLLPDAELVTSSGPNQVIDLEVTSMVREGITNGRLYVALQPLVNVSTNSIIGVEALVRLDDDTGNQLPTSVILNIASVFDLMNELSTHTLDLAFEQTMVLHRQWPELVRVHVNLEAMQLMDETIYKHILSKLEEYPSLDLTIELTENSLYETSKQLFNRINELRFEFGVEFAMDDFGKEFSSLRALVHFPVDMVKMDRTFAQALVATEDRSALIIHALVQLSDQLKYSILVEGIEDPRQATQLRTIGVNMAQGFHYCKPISVDALQHRFEKFGLAAEIDAYLPTQKEG